MLKTVEDAYILADKIKESYNIIIVGGGLTGVEVAGELATKTKKKITIVHGLSRLMERQPKNVSEIAHNYLVRKGVKILLNSHSEWDT